MKLEAAVLFLVRAFIARQKLVSDVIQNLRPDMFAFHDKSVPAMVKVTLARKYTAVPQTGSWQNDEGDWVYFFHGGGCRLTHKVTGEVIDWDAPNTELFDPWKFMYWVEWAINTNPEHLSEQVHCLNEAVSTDSDLKTVVDNILKHLTEQGVFEKASQGRLFFR